MNIENRRSNATSLHLLEGYSRFKLKQIMVVSAIFLAQWKLIETTIFQK